MLKFNEDSVCDRVTDAFLYVKDWDDRNSGIWQTGRQMVMIHSGYLLSDTLAKYRKESERVDSAFIALSKVLPDVLVTAKALVAEHFRNKK